MTDPTERALALAGEVLPSGEALAQSWSRAIERSYGEHITDVEALIRELRPAVARVIQGVMDERDALEREVEKLRDDNVSLNELVHEFVDVHDINEKLRARDQRIRELADIVDAGCVSEVPVRNLLDAIEETP